MLKTKKTILLFIDWYLPGYKAGGPIQSCANLVNHLNNDYCFKIITRNTDYCETIPYQDIKSNEWNIVNQNTHIYYIYSYICIYTNTHITYIFIYIHIYI